MKHVKVKWNNGKYPDNKEFEILLPVDRISLYKEFHKGYHDWDMDREISEKTSYFAIVDYPEVSSDKNQSYKKITITKEHYDEIEKALWIAEAPPVDGDMGEKVEEF